MRFRITLAALAALLLLPAGEALAAKTPAATKVTPASTEAGPAFKTKEAGDWNIRLRGLGVMTQEDGDIKSAVTGAGLGLNAEVKEDVIPELDISYFLTKNIALELVLGTSRHEVNALNAAGVSTRVGDVSLLPPTLTAQYHFLPDSRYSPYLSAGINYTIFYGEDAAGGTITNTSYDDNFGYALGGGFDIAVQDGWSLNFDVKKLFLSTTVRGDSPALGKWESDVDLDPVLVSVGVGYRFQ